MIEHLSAKPGVMALRVRGHVSREDVDSCLELLTEELAKREQISLYVEVVELSGFDTEAVAVGFDRGAGLLRQLDRFGRVAIVSDQAWIRWLARVESAIWPGISYRTYTLAEREMALAWVQGAMDLPYGRAIKIIPTTRADAIGIEIDGRLANRSAARIGFCR